GLVAELVVQGAAGYPGGPHDLLGAHAGVAVGAEQRARSAHQLPPGRLGAQIVLGPGHVPAALLSYVLSVCNLGTDSMYVIAPSHRRSHVSDRTAPRHRALSGIRRWCAGRVPSRLPHGC